MWSPPKRSPGPADVCTPLPRRKWSQEDSGYSGDGDALSGEGGSTRAASSGPYFLGAFPFRLREGDPLLLQATGGFGNCPPSREGERTACRGHPGDSPGSLCHQSRFLIQSVCQFDHKH